MEKQEPSSPEVERLKNENATLRKRIRMLEAELLRLQAKLVSTWGEA
jgi:chaperonin cofactor prefoldin